MGSFNEVEDGAATAAGGAPVSRDEDDAAGGWSGLAAITWVPSISCISGGLGLEQTLSTSLLLFLRMPPPNKRFGSSSCGSSAASTSNPRSRSRSFSFMRTIRSCSESSSMSITSMPPPSLFPPCMTELSGVCSMFTICVPPKLTFFGGTLPMICVPPTAIAVEAAAAAAEGAAGCTNAMPPPAAVRKAVSGSTAGREQLDDEDADVVAAAAAGAGALFSMSEPRCDSRIDPISCVPAFPRRPRNVVVVVRSSSFDDFAGATTSPGGPAAPASSFALIMSFACSWPGSTSRI
mmetsp:Transcript_27625/g.69649  ORF Transcript_27625/g.69649 Transcript_27625/m.69649 type:complete len:292 (-) Transcript_27625:301-1176(-)